MDCGLVGEACAMGKALMAERIGAEGVGLSTTSIDTEKDCVLVQPIVDSKSGSVLGVLICCNKQSYETSESATLFTIPTFTLSDL